MDVCNIPVEEKKTRVRVQVTFGVTLRTGVGVKVVVGEKYGVVL